MTVLLEVVLGAKTVAEAVIWVVLGVGDRGTGIRVSRSGALIFSFRVDVVAVVMTEDAFWTRSVGEGSDFITSYNNLLVLFATVCIMGTW